jgi:hypothetical protein
VFVCDELLELLEPVSDDVVEDVEEGEEIAVEDATGVPIKRIKQPLSSLGGHAN